MVAFKCQGLWVLAISNLSQEEKTEVKVPNSCPKFRHNPTGIILTTDTDEELKNPSGFVSAFLRPK